MWNVFNTETVERIKSMQEIREYNQGLPDMENKKEEKAIIKTYIADLIMQCIEEDTQDRPRSFSRSDIIREILLMHCYGRMAVKHNAWKREQRLYNRAKYQPNMMQENYRVADLGKSNIPLSITCHPKLKEDLTTLADLRYLNLSEYVREILITHYLGNGFMPNQDPIAIREE